MSVELASAYVALVPSAKGIASGIAAELGAPAEKAAVSAGAQASGGFAKQFGAGLGSLKGAIGAALPVAAVVAVGAGLLSVGSDFKTAFDQIRVTTGQTGPALAGLKDDFKAVLEQRPEGMDKVSAAIATLNQRLGLTGEPLQTMATRVLQLSSITKTDLGANLESVTALFNNFGVAAGDQPRKLDELFRASQATGASVSDLAGSMAKGGSVLRQAGFDFESSAALLGLLSKSGVDASVVMPSLSRAIKTAAKDGKSAGDVFRDTFNAIRNAPSDTAAAGKAIEVFGARAGPNLAGLIRQGKLSYAELTAQISSGGDTIAQAAKDTAGLGSKWSIFLNRLKVKVEPVATLLLTNAIKGAAAALSFVTDAWDNIVAGFQNPDAQNAIGGVAGYLLGLGATVRQFVDFMASHRELLIGVLVALGVGIASVVVPAVISFTAALVGLIASAVVAAAPFVLIGAAIAALAAGILWAYHNVKPFHDAIDSIGRALSAAFGWVKAFANALIGGDWSKAREMLIGLRDAILSGLADLGPKILPFLRGLLSTITGWITGTAWPFLKANAPGWIAAFLGWFVEINGKLAGMLGGFLSAIGSWITGTAFPYLVANAPGWIAAFLSWLGQASITLLGKLGEFLALIGGWILGTALPFIGSQVATLGGAFLSWLASAIAALPGHLAEFLGQVIGFAIGLGIRLPMLMLQAFNALLGWVIDAGIQVVPKLAAFGGAVGVWLLQLPGRIAGWVAGALPAILGWIANAAMQAPGQLALLAAKFTDWAMRLPGVIISAIGDIGGKMFSVGASVVQGIWNGINSLGDWIKDRIGDFAGGIIDGIKGAFGINSPARTMLPVGSSIVEGVAVGIDRNHSFALSALDRLAGTVSSRAIGPFVAGAPSWDTGGSAAAPMSGAGMNFYGPVTFGSEAAADDLDFWTRTKHAGV